MQYENNHFTYIVLVVLVKNVFDFQVHRHRKGTRTKIQRRWQTS